MSATRGLAVGLEIDGDGAHPAAWRAAEHHPRDLLTSERLAVVGRHAEAGGFGFVTIDSRDRRGFDPVTAAAFLSAHTTALGLLPVVPTARAEPFHVSNQLSGLDHASVGRAGWWLRADGEPAETVDVVDAARRLWDSWQDDAVIADEASGRFLDADRVHHVDFVGRTFSVRGPALVPRPPQGQVPVLAPDGVLPPGLVDVGVVSAPTVEGLLDREVTAPRSLAEIEVVLDAGAPGAERLAALDQEIPWPRGERLRWVGPPEELAAVLRRLADRVDAVRLVPAVLDVDLAVLTGAVLPALGALLRRPAPGATLRALFALERPAGRWAS